MDALLVLLFIGLVVGAAVVYMRGRKEAAAGAPAPTGLSEAPASEPVGGVEARAMKLGDVVNHDGRDWIVEGTLRFEQGGFRWAEHRLVDGADSLWLSVEDDEGLELVIWTRVRGSVLEPGPGTLEHSGVTYELDEKGRANYTSEGVTGARRGRQGRVRRLHGRRQAAVLRALRRRRRLGDLGRHRHLRARARHLSEPRRMSDAIADAEATERGLREQIADLVHARARADSEAARLADRATLDGAHEELAEIAGTLHRNRARRSAARSRRCGPSLRAAEAELERLRAPAG